MTLSARCRYTGYRDPPEIISHAVWLYFRFPLSLRMVEELLHGTGETFEDARAGFEKAWQQLSATRTEAHFELWRQSRDFHAWKGRMHDERLPMPTQRTDGRSRCFCGAEITNFGVPAHIQAAHRGIGA